MPPNKLSNEIKGGCVLLARRLLDSGIWRKPPEYLKAFIYILLSVNHSDTSLFPKGSNLFNFSNIKIPGVSQNQIYDFLRWGANSGVLTKQKTTRGVILKLNNYSYFQLLENYKLQNKFQQNSKTINKNVKNGIKEYKPNSEEYNLSHITKEKNRKSDFEREFSFSKEDYQILKEFAKKHAKHNYFAYLRSLTKDFVGASSIIAEVKCRREIFKKEAEIQAQSEFKEDKTQENTLEKEIHQIKTQKEAIEFILKRNKALQIIPHIPQYKSLMQKFNLTLEILRQHKLKRNG